MLIVYHISGHGLSKIGFVGCCRVGDLHKAGETGTNRNVTKSNKGKCQILHFLLQGQPHAPAGVWKTAGKTAL